MTYSDVAGALLVELEKVRKDLKFKQEELDTTVEELAQTRSELKRMQTIVREASAILEAS